MIRNRLLTKDEKENLDENYLRVVEHYERVTRRRMTSDEMIVLKLMVEKAYPAQINQMISRFWKLYPDRFTSLHYIYKPVCNMFKNKR